VPAAAVAEPSFADEEAVREYVSESPPPVVESSPASRAAKSGLGYLAIIVLVIAFKMAPRILREIFREPKPQRPVQMRPDDQQAIQRMLQEAAKNAENARQKNRNLPDPLVPPP
jgi:hypothetical protein